MSRALAVLALVAAVFIPGATAGRRPHRLRLRLHQVPDPACAGVGLRQSPYFTRNDCGFAEVRIDGTQRPFLPPARGAFISATCDVVRCRLSRIVEVRPKRFRGNAQ